MGASSLKEPMLLVSIDGLYLSQKIKHKPGSILLCNVSVEKDGPRSINTSMSVIDGLTDVVITIQGLKNTCLTKANHNGMKKQIRRASATE